MSPASWLHHTQVRRQSAPPSQGSLRTRQTPHVWNVKLDSMLSELRFKHNDYEHAVCTHDKGPARLHVDVPNHHRQLPDQINKFKHEMQASFKMSVILFSVSI
jgi:hypothetical protein